ncbi:gamma-glutamylcyclotransferase [Oricola nitratireducens]|uniref:gamma-glutamylcyclotransferase n=1 Tax=Oricola nitratireducens TaxID=2775868 RepID=UPI0018686417|nr:gamma-glutamylcyclotransferase [Oricola nitratireducens]
MMPPVADPFAHHPELRGKIVDPLQSSFRTFTTARLAKIIEEQGLPGGWWYSDEEREASRAEALAGNRDRDLWVFAYGSLMWDPAFRFAEVRRAHVPGYARRFILKDILGGRGTRDAPGLMAALDKGPGCEGLLFRIVHDHVEEETEVLWRREKVGPAYIPTFVDAVVSGERVPALAFVADHEAELIDASLTRDEQIHYLATGTGFLGTSLEYLENIASHFAALGIEDEDVSALLRDTESYMKSLQAP